MSKNKKKTVAKKKTPAKKKPAPKKKAPVVDKIEIDIPTQEEVKELVTETFAALKADDFKFTPTVKKGLLSKIKRWFKVS
jgi:hypothetical protein